jgi:hypothetical protein
LSARRKSRARPDSPEKTVKSNLEEEEEEEEE